MISALWGASEKQTGNIHIGGKYDYFKTSLLRAACCAVENEPLVQEERNVEGQVEVGSIPDISVNYTYSY